MSLHLAVTVVLLLLGLCEAATYQYFLWNGITGFRQSVGAKAVLSVYPLDMRVCQDECLALPTCYAFNWNFGTRACETVLITRGTTQVADPIPDARWTYFPIQSFVQNPCSWPVCASTAACLTYPKIYWETPVVNGQQTFYTCSGHSWLMDKWNAGQTNCSFNQTKNVDFRGHDIAAYNQVALHYTVLFDNCYSYGCLSILCYGPHCWMKNASQAQYTTQSLTSLYGSAYFWADCH